MLSCDVPAGCWEPLRTLFYRAFVPDGTFGMSGGSLSAELWPLSGPGEIRTRFSYRAMAPAGAFWKPHRLSYYRAMPSAGAVRGRIIFPLFSPGAIAR